MTRPADRRGVSTMLLRAVFIALLVANLGYCGWVLSRQEPTAAIETVQRGEPLVLLSEQEVVGAERIAATTSEETVESCFALGPFRSQAEVQRTFAALEPFIERSRERREVTETTDGFWVFLPAVATREEAIEQARQLAQAGVRDYYVVTGGDSENTVSLGVYGDRANADFRAETLIDQGFDARVEQRTEPGTQFWLDYSPRANAVAPWQRVVAGNPDLGHDTIDCF